MTTADSHTSIDPPGDRLEDALVALFSIEPPRAVLDRLDARVVPLIQAWRPAAPSRRRILSGRRIGAVALLAALFVAAGAGGLYELLVGPFADVPWQRGETLGLSQVVGGYRVTIDRAYADSIRLALQISVVDEEHRAGTTQLAAMSTVVTDIDGEYSGIGATSSPDGAFRATDVVWKAPAVAPLPAGPRHLHVVVPTIMVRTDATSPPDAAATDMTPWTQVAGPWTFDFDLDVDGGTAFDSTTSDAIGGIRVTASRLVASSSVVRVDLHVGGDIPPGTWTPIGEVRHGDKVFRFVAAKVGPDGTFTLLTDGGAAELSGPWTVTIDELRRDGDSLAGPWVLRFGGP